MSQVGGSIESVEIDGRSFSVAADADATRKIGGFENEMQSNGDGSARQIKTRVPWSVEGLTVAIDDDRGDESFLQALANASRNFPVVITYASGKSLQGTGQITGDNPTSSQSQTKQISLGGPGNLTVQ